MNKLLLDASVVGGYPLFVDDLEFEQSGIREALSNLNNIFGSNHADGYILFGCVPSGIGPINVSAGAVVLGGEIFTVDAHTVPLTAGHVRYWEIQETFDSAGQQLFEDASTKDTYVVRKAKVVSIISGSEPADNLPFDVAASNNTNKYIYDKYREIMDSTTSTYFNIGAGGQPPFLNGWINEAGGLFNVAGYKLDMDGKLSLRGYVDGASSTGSILFTLPAGFRPANNIGAIIWDAAGANVGLCVVATNGDVSIVVAAGTKKFHLNDITPFELT